MNLSTKQKQIHSLREQTWLPGEGWEKGIVKELGINMYTQLYFKWVTNKDILYSTENSAQC